MFTKRKLKIKDPCLRWTAADGNARHRACARRSEGADEQIIRAVSDSGYWIYLKIC